MGNLRTNEQLSQLEQDARADYAARRTTLIVDGNNMLYRMLYQPNLGFLSSPSGESTGGTFGVLRSLKKVLTHNPYINKAVFVLDAGMSARRLAIDPDYKGARRKSKKDAVDAKGVPLPWSQKFEMKGKQAMSLSWRKSFLYAFEENLAQLETILPALCVRVLSVNGKEGDDVAALVATDDELSGPNALIVSEDKDFLQLVCDTITVWRPIADIVVTKDNFLDVVGFDQSVYLLARAIIGDASDGIVGVKGTGPKAAEAIFAQATDFDSMVAFCSASTKKSIQQVSAPEHLDRVRRNVALMDLSQEVFTVEDLEHVQKVMWEKAKMDVPAACDVLNEMGAEQTVIELENPAMNPYRMLEE